MNAGSPMTHSLRMFVVLNPVAGTSSAERIREGIRQRFDDTDIHHEIYETTGEEHVAQVVCKALDQGYNLFVAAGGDGTVSEVITGLAQTNTPIAILPTGTANTLARDLGVPLDLDRALDLLAGDHTTRDIDLMQVGDEFFVLNISVGVSSLTMHDTRRDEKRRFGIFAYLWKGAKWLTGFQPRRFTITVDGKRRRFRASEVMVANSGMLGMRPFTWGSHISMDDGQLDVCIVHAQRAPDYLRVIWSTMWNLHKPPQVTYLTARRSVTIDSDWALPVQADGEVIGQTPIHVELAPKALRVVVPAPADEQPQGALAGEVLSRRIINSEQ